MGKARKGLAISVALAVGATLGAASGLAQPVDTGRIDAGSQNDWLTYHGSYKGYHYSPLDQINASNVGNLGVAWMHIPGRSTRGLQSMPIVADGVLYYTGSYSRVWALDAATGKPIWSYFPKLNDDLVAAQTHSPYTRGIALGQGKVFVGTVDGRLIALDMKTGQPAWDTKLVNSEKLTVGFTGAPLFVKDKVIIGSQGGEWPGRGPIFGVDAASGRKVWEFLTVAGTEDSKKTWGNDSWRTGGGGGWMAGGYDAETNTVWWGTGNPAPLYDWAGSDWKTTGPRPGDNLFTTSVIALDADTGRLKFYHQELPHDAWDFDSAVGEFVMLERDGKDYIVHPNKGGFVFVYDRGLKVQNVWQGVKNINFVKTIDPKTKKESIAKEAARAFLCVAFSPDGKRVAAGNNDGYVKIWDIEGKKEVNDLKAHEGVMAHAYSPDGSRLATGGYDQTIKLWDTATGKDMRTIKAHLGTVTTVAFSADGSQLASGGLDALVKIWSVDTKK